MNLMKLNSIIQNIKELFFKIHNSRKYEKTKA